MTTVASEIPTASRVLVRARDVTCVRCNTVSGGMQWHHRRTRSVNDEHQHCACVGILLCATCHSWVHQHPAEARANGWIVSRFETQPYVVPFRRPPTAWVLPNCEGEARRVTAASMEVAQRIFGVDPGDAEVIQFGGR